MNLCGTEVPDSWKLLATKKLSRALEFRRYRGVAAVLTAVAVAVCAIVELRSSWLESHLLPAIDRRLAFSLKSGPSSDVERPSAGPYDQRLGFYNLQEFISRLKNKQYDVAAQARVSETAHALGPVPIFETTG